MVETGGSQVQLVLSEKVTAWRLFGKTCRWFVYFALHMYITERFMQFPYVLKVYPILCVRAPLCVFLTNEGHTARCTSSKTNVHTHTKSSFWHQFQWNEVIAGSGTIRNVAITHSSIQICTGPAVWLVEAHNVYHNNVYLRFKRRCVRACVTNIWNEHTHVQAGNHTEPRSESSKAYSGNRFTGWKVKSTQLVKLSFLKCLQCLTYISYIFWCDFICEEWENAI